MFDVILLPTSFRVDTPQATVENSRYRANGQTLHRHSMGYKIPSEKSRKRKKMADSFVDSGKIGISVIFENPIRPLLQHLKDISYYSGI